MCEVLMMGRASTVSFRSRRVMLMLYFPLLNKNFLSDLKFTKKIEKCVQVDFGVTDYESVIRFS